MRLSYSVRSAPEYWSFTEDNVVKKSDNTYIFDVRGSLSNNGTKFSSKKESITLLFDFGDIKEIGIDYIISKKEL